MSDTRSNPPSPGAGPPDAEDDEVSKASQRASPLPHDEGVAPSKVSKYENREFLLFYQKKFYKVPADHVVFDMGKPFGVETGEAAHKLHECKSHQTWLDAGVHTRHFVKLKFDLRGKTQTGFYITFKVNDEESDDVYIIRALHKTISKKFYDQWTGPEEKGGWSQEKIAGKFKELVLDEPSDEAQISPVAAGYDVVSEPGNVLYTRPKKVPPSGPPAKKAKGAGGKAQAPPQADDDDDDQSSAAQSTALVAVPPAPAMGGMPMPPIAGSGGPSFFMQTPGQVTISESWLQHLIANQR